MFGEILIYWHAGKIRAAREKSYKVSFKSPKNEIDQNITWYA